MKKKDAYKEFGKLIQQARSIDLASFLLSIGEPLKPEQGGRRHRHETHDSLVITGNVYMWNSRGREHGDSIDFLVRHLGYDFKSAVIALTGGDYRAFEEAEEPLAVKYDINRECLTKNYNRSVAYLNKSRFIDSRLIVYLIKNNLLYQEQITNNIIFPIYDENKIVVGAEVQGTLSDKRFKQVRAGTKYGYGYNMRMGTGVDIDDIYFFESVIDLLSYLTIKKRRNAKVGDSLFVSLAGVKDNILRHMLQCFSAQKATLHLCVDADNGGRKFVQMMQNDYPTLVYENPYKGCDDDAHKDWNDYLREVHKSSQ